MGAFICDSALCVPQEFWDEGHKSGWEFERLYSQAYRLFDNMVSTKECLEDCFAYLSHRNKKDNRNPLFQTVERLFFHAAVSPRWIDEAWPRVRLQPGDLRNQDALNHARGRTAYIPARHSESATYQAVKQFVDAGGQRRATQPCVRENKETWVWVWVSVRAISRFSLSLSLSESVSASPYVFKGGGGFMSLFVRVSCSVSVCACVSVSSCLCVCGSPVLSSPHAETQRHKHRHRHTHTHTRRHTETHRDRDT